MDLVTADWSADGPLHENAPEQDGLDEYAHLGPYRLVQRIGEGGMGVVHLALDRHGRAVAIKVLRPHVAADPLARARLKREVDTLARIKSDRVAPIIDADVDGPTPYIVTRYVPGRALDDVVGRQGPMPPKALHRIAAGLAEALDVIHSADVIHRDVKPANVLVVDDDPVLIDFGIAHVADDIRLTQTGLVMGTPGYLAPEVVEGDSVSRATDWWGWAATVAFAATGAPPFGRGAMDVVLARVARGEPDLTSVDPRIEPLLYAALSPRPDERPRHWEIVAALESYAHGVPVTEVIEVRRARPVTEAIGVPMTAVMPVSTPPQAPAAAPPVTPSLVAPAPVALAPVARAVQPAPASAPVPPAYAPVPAPRPAGPPPSELGQALDPRIGREARTGVLLAMLTGIAGVASAAPYVAIGLLILWMALARTADRSVTSLVMRRHERGQRSSDVAVAVAASPWHLVIGAIGAVLTAVLPVFVGVCAVFASALVIAMLGSTDVQAAAPGPLAIGGAFAALAAWWGPGGASLRRGSRSLVRGVTPTATAAQVLAGVVVVAAVAMAVSGVVRGGPQWWPAVQAPGIIGSSFSLP